MYFHVFLFDYTQIKLPVSSTEVMLYASCEQVLLPSFEKLEPRHEKTNVLLMRKQRRRSASR